MSNQDIINPKPQKSFKPYEGRETEEWWWGGKSSRFDSRVYDTNPDDEPLDDCQRFDKLTTLLIEM